MLELFVDTFGILALDLKDGGCACKGFAKVVEIIGGLVVVNILKTK